MLESGYDQFPCAHSVRSRQEALIHSVDKIQQSINGFLYGSSLRRNFYCAYDNKCEKNKSF